MIPIDLLPIKPPSEFDPGPTYFYENVVKQLIPDFIRIMNSGLHIDDEAVDELRLVLDGVLETVETRLLNNQLIQDFQANEYPKIFAKYKEEVEASMRTLAFYTKEYNPKNAVHRSYIVNTRLELINKLDLCKPSWSAKEVKTLSGYVNDMYIEKIVNKTIPVNDTIAKEAMVRLAKDKLDIWNKPRLNKISNVTQETLLPPFNPGSSLQLSKLFEFFKVEPLAFSKDTGAASWGRSQVEEVMLTTDDPVRLDIYEAFIDFSFSSIVRKTFVEGFDKFTIDHLLHGNFKLFGAKTFRPTSNSINLLNMPSTRSIYAKPLKKCIVAPPGYVVWTIDFAALEDRVIANLSGDVNKLNVFVEGLDGHSLNACGYWPEKVAKELGPNTDNVAYVQKFKAAVDAGNKVLKKIRTESKAPTFGLAYGAYPKKIADTIKCSMEVATEIFNNYHNSLYPGITNFRERVIIPNAKRDGYIHMGLGCRMYVDDIEKDSRTLFNSASQFWSILTLIAIHRLHNEMKERTDIVVNATIYDAIYGIVEDTPESIKWLNDTICPIMEQDFLENQTVPNEANLEIGPNWSDMTELPHNCSIEHIQGVIDELRYDKTK